MGTDSILPMYFQGLYPTNEFHKIDLWSSDFYKDALDFYSKKTGEDGRQMLIKGIAYLIVKIHLIEDLYDVLKVWDSASSTIFSHEVFNRESPNLITEFRIEVSNVFESKKQKILESNKNELIRLKEEGIKNKIIIDSLIKDKKTELNTASYGFKSLLTEKQIDAFYEKMQDLYFNTTIENFKAIFSNRLLPNGFEKIKWIDKNNKKKPNQTSLREFLKATMVFSSNEPPQDLINNCFTDSNGQKIILAKFKKDSYTIHYHKKFTSWITK
ncbi:MAG TPA: hypothetical protein DCR40_08380 [Prolixibacteraceae bacterium]|nr:hypothetical protein [Prolixibacteraceae bacterium]